MQYNKKISMIKDIHLLV